MLRVTTLSGMLLLLSCVPGSLGVLMVKSAGLVRGDITGSAAMELTLGSEPGRDVEVRFTFNDVDVFSYIPFTGAIPGGDSNARYDPRFTIYNTSTRGFGFRLAGLRLEDAGTYGFRYKSLSNSFTVKDVLFVYDVPGRPVIEASPQILVEGVTNVSLECGASSTSLPMIHRTVMLYRWSRNGVDIDRTGPPERHAVHGDSGQILDISPVNHTDTTYTCTASENGTQLTSEETEVTLDVLHGPNNLKIKPENPSPRESASLEITLSADCNPACHYTWSIGDDVISQGPLLKFDKFQSRNANNYTVRAENAYGTADLRVEVKLDTSPSKHTIPAENEFWTTDSGVTATRDTKRAPESGGSFIVIAGSAAAGGVVLLIIKIIVTVVLCGRRKRKHASEYVNSEVLGGPGHPMDDYVNSELFGAPGHPTGDYMTIDEFREPGQPTDDDMTADVFREPGQPTGDYLTTDVFREPGHRANDYVNSEICREPTSAGNQPIDASRQYERMDMTTREPRDQLADASRQYERLDMTTSDPPDPTNRVYLVLQP